MGNLLYDQQQLILRWQKLLPTVQDQQLGDVSPRS